MIVSFSAFCIGTEAQPAASTAAHIARKSFMVIPPFRMLTIGGKHAAFKEAPRGPSPCGRREPKPCASGYSDFARRKRVALADVAGLQSNFEPAHTLRRRAVRERLRHHVAARALL